MDHATCGYHAGTTSRFLEQEASVVRLSLGEASTRVAPTCSACNPETTRDLWVRLLGKCRASKAARIRNSHL